MLLAIRQAFFGRENDFVVVYVFPYRFLIAGHLKIVNSAKASNSTIFFTVTLIRNHCSIKRDFVSKFEVCLARLALPNIAGWGLLFVFECVSTPLPYWFYKGGQRLLYFGSLHYGRDKLRVG